MTYHPGNQSNRRNASRSDPASPIYNARCLQLTPKARMVGQILYCFLEAFKARTQLLHIAHAYVPSCVRDTGSVVPALIERISRGYRVRRCSGLRIQCGVVNTMQYVWVMVALLRIFQVVNTMQYVCRMIALI